jgi:pimeloyl-ACP methyl ester carboxylesterase
MVLRPSRYPIEHAPLTRVMLQSSGRPLECFTQKNFDGEQPPELLVLKFPGTAGRAERSTEFPLSNLGDVRGTMWTWNPPGYGRSAGRASLTRIADAAIDFWKQVTQRELAQSTSVWLCGNSLGSATALHVAAAMQPDPIKSGIILRNTPPLALVVKRAAQHYPLARFVGPIAESLCDSMNVILTARKVNLPAIFLQSELDSLVPVAYQNQIVKAYAGESRVVLMEGLSHGGVATEFHEPMIDDSLRWLWEQTGCKTNEPYSAS